MKYYFLMITLILTVGFVHDSYAESKTELKDSKIINQESYETNSFNTGEFLGRYFAWSSSTLFINGHNTCQAFSISANHKGYFSIDHSPSTGIINEIVLFSNPSFKYGTVVKLLVDGAYAFYFQSYGKYAMIRDYSKLERFMNTLFASARVLEVSGVDRKGLKINYNFSLKGLTQAYNRINEFCVNGN